MCEELATAASARYTEALVRAGPVVAARIMKVATFLKERFVSIITEKGAFYEHIPFTICAAFGHYVGFPLDVVKAKIRKGFAEYAAVENKAALDFVTEWLWGGESEISRALKAFGEDPSTELDYYENLFVTV